MRNILKHPETGINIVCLAISALAPTVAIGAAVGIPTGAAIALGLYAVIKGQRDRSGSVRTQYFIGAWIIRIFAGAFEQMAYYDQFVQRTTLPFGMSATTWAWIATVFMACLDIWALSATAAKSQAEVEDQVINESIERAERQDREKQERVSAEAEAERAHAVEMAKITADAEKRKAEVEAEAKAEAAKAEARSKAEIEKTRAEAQAETERTRAETERKKAEVEAEARKVEAEAKRKQSEAEAEAKRKQAEAEATKAEAERQRTEAERKRKEAERAEIQRIEQEKKAKEQAEAERIERERKEQTERTEAERKQKAEAEAARRNWSPETWRQEIAKAEAELNKKLGRKPTRAEVAERLGTSDRTIRNYANAA